MNHMFDTDIWYDIRDLPPLQALIMLYLDYNPSGNIYGIYRINVESVRDWFGISIEEVQAVLTDLEAQELISVDGDIIWVRDKWARARWKPRGTKSPMEMPIVKGLVNVLEKYDQSVIPTKFLKHYKKTAMVLRDKPLNGYNHQPLIPCRVHNKDSNNNQSIIKEEEMNIPDDGTWGPVDKRTLKCMSETFARYYQPTVNLIRELMWFQLKVQAQALTWDQINEAARETAAAGGKTIKYWRTICEKKIKGPGARTEAQKPDGPGLLAINRNTGETRQIQTRGDATEDEDVI